MATIYPLHKLTLLLEEYDTLKMSHSSCLPRKLICTSSFGGVTVSYGSGNSYSARALHLAQTLLPFDIQDVRPAANLELVKSYENTYRRGKSYLFFFSPPLVG
jgi:hypothetical protein